MVIAFILNPYIHTAHLHWRSVFKTEEMQQQAIEVGTRGIQTPTSRDLFVQIEAHAVLADGGSLHSVRGDGKIHHWKGAVDMRGLHIRDLQPPMLTASKVDADLGVR